jgi:hypothetical protein
MLLKFILYVNCVFIFMSGMYIEYQSNDPSIVMILNCFLGVIISHALLFMEEDLF